jgi:hypothetical protein
MISVLPESEGTPSGRQRANGASIASDPQWAGRSEYVAITSAHLPPVGAGVDHWVAVRLGTVSVGEIADPADHCRCAQSITGGAVWVICPMGDERLGAGRSKRSKIHDSYFPSRLHPGE